MVLERKTEVTSTMLLENLYNPLVCFLYMNIYFILGKENILEDLFVDIW